MTTDNPMFSDCNSLDEVAVVLWRQTPADERLASVTAFLADPLFDRTDLRMVAKKMRKAGIVEVAELAKTAAKVAKRKPKRKATFTGWHGRRR